MGRLLPQYRAAKRDLQFIAECLIKAADQVDMADNGQIICPVPEISDFVTRDEMADKWMWALIALIDYMDMTTGDVRRLANAISGAAQNTLFD